MAKKLLFAVCAAMVFTGTASAGEIFLSTFPTTYIPQEITDIPVLMDIGYFVFIRDQDKLQIKLLPTGVREYEGCTNVEIEANFDLRLSCDIVANGAVDGDYSCSVTPNLVDAPGGTVAVCAQLVDASLLNVVGGTMDVQVATVTLKVAPR